MSHFDVLVYQFTCWDSEAKVATQSPLFATAEAIGKGLGVAIPASAMVVPMRDVFEGFYIPTQAASPP